MNALDRAKDRMKNGWCTGDVYQDGKFCSTGALAVELGVNFLTDTDVDTGEEFHFLEDLDCYKVVERSKEGEILADTVCEMDPKIADERKIHLLNVSEVIFEFNDKQKDFGPIEQLFEKASAKYDESHS